MPTADDEVQYFVGREAELQALCDFVADPSPGVLLVTGLPGIGKSFLLRRFAQEARHHAELLVCRRSLTAEAGPIDLAHLALDIAQSRHSPFDRDLRKALRKGGIKVVEDFSLSGLKPLKILAALVEGSTEMQREDLEADDYVRLLARVIRETAGAMKCDQCLVGILDADKYFQQDSLRKALDHIIATLPERAKLVLGLREGDPFLKAYHILEREEVHQPPPLAELAHKAGEELIQKHFDEDAPPDLINGLIERCGLLPLALDAGIKLIQQSNKESVEALEDLPGDCSATNLMHQLARAALASERPGEDMVRILALTREPLSLEELTAVLRSSGREDDAADVDRALRSRAIIDVLERRGNGEVRYRLYHDWMRDAVLGLTEPSIARPLHQALGEFYWARLDEDEQAERAMRHCTHHLAQGGLADVEAKQRFVAGVCLSASQKRKWGLTRDVDAELKLTRKLLEDEALEVNPLFRGIIWNQSGLLAKNSGDLRGALAYLERVRALAPELERLSDEQGKQCVATALGNIGLVYREMGRLREGLQAHQDALLEQEIGDRQGEAIQLNNIGLVYRDMGRPEEALQAHQDALEIAGEIGYRLGEASTICNIGVVYRRMGRLKEALQAHQDAFKIDQEIGYRLGQAQNLGNIGNVYANMGRREEALQAHQKALKIDQEIGHRLGEAQDLHNIGLVYEDMGKCRRALDYLQQALVIFEEIGAALDIERTKRNIARIEEKLDESES